MPFSTFSRTARTLAGLVFLGIGLPNQALSASGIGVFPDKYLYIIGQDTPRFSVSGFTDEEVRADIYVGVITPDGTIHTYPGWTVWGSSAKPWLADFRLPADFRYSAAPHYSLSGFPGGLVPGNWQVAAALTQPGTTNLLAVDLVPFRVAEAGNGSAYGSVSLAHQRSAEGQEQLSGSGIFVESGATLQDLMAGYIGQQPALNQCVLNEIPLDLQNTQGISAQTLDMGTQISIRRSNGAVSNISKDTDAAAQNFYYYSSEPATDFFLSGSRYDTGSEGGPKTKSFSVVIKAPVRLNLTSPDLSSQTSHSTGSDLNLAWNGANGVGEVHASLSGSDLSTNYTINCRFTDDGEAVIPASLLTQLRDRINSALSAQNQMPDTATIPGLGNQAHLQVSRVKHALFDLIGGNKDMGVSAISTGSAGTLGLK